MADTLAKQVIEFTVQGMEAVRAAMNDINARIQATPVAIGAAVAGFQLLTNATRAWVSAGLAGTNYGNALSFQLTLLSQQIAGVFVPTIRMVIDALRNLTQWLRNLTGEQQTSIRHFVEAAAVMAVVFAAVGRVKTVLISLAGSLVGVVAPAFTALVGIVTTGSLTMATAINLATAGITAIIGLIVSAATAAITLGAGIVAGTAAGRSAFGDLAEMIRPIWEGLQRIYAVSVAVLGPELEAIGRQLGTFLREFMVNIEGMSASFRSVIPLVQVGLRLLGATIAVLSNVLAGTVVVVIWAAGVIADVLVPVINGLLSVLAALVESLGVVGDAFDLAFGTSIGNSIRSLAGTIRALRVEMEPTVMPAAQSQQTARTDVQPVGGHFQDAQALFRQMTEASVRGAVEAREAANAANLAQIAANTTPRPASQPLMHPEAGNAQWWFRKKQNILAGGGSLGGIG